MRVGGLPPAFSSRQRLFILKKGQTLQQLSVEKFAAEGKCIARHGERAVFLKFTAPGDVVDARITKKRKGYLEAEPTHFHQYSPLRQAPFCEAFGTCGGCKWQHVPYGEQLQFKQQQVLDQLQRIGKLELPEPRPILGSELTQAYRNKMEYTFTARRWLTQAEINSGQEFERRGAGFHIPGRFDFVLDIDRCYLQEDLSNHIRNFIRDWAIERDLPFFDLLNHQGFLRTLLLRNNNAAEWMVVLQVYEDRPEWLGPLMEALRENFPQVVSLNYVLNPKANDTIYDLEVVNHAGKPFLLEQLEDLQFKVGPKSFFQTNTAQALKLYRVVREWAGLSGEEVVYDLYSGTGTIALFLARQAQAVYGFESVQMAVEDARYNAEINGIGNAYFHCGDLMKLVQESSYRQLPPPQLLITDPPRAGMHQKVVDSILSLAPPRLIYVSCNPATQARDLAALSEKYLIKALQPVDMFPHTQHVENVALLELR